MTAGREHRRRRPVRLPDREWLEAEKARHEAAKAAAEAAAADPLAFAGLVVTGFRRLPCGCRWLVESGTVDTGYCALGHD